MLKSVVWRWSLPVMLPLAVALAGISTAGSYDTRFRAIDADQRPARLGRQAAPRSYRSPGSRHKLLIARQQDGGLSQLLSSGSAGSKVKNYGSYSVVEVDDATLASLDASQLARAAVRDDFNLVLLKSGQLDTTGPEPILDPGLRQPRARGRSLHLIQLFGPPTNAALAAIKATGVEVVSYIPNNTYLVWATASQISAVRTLQRQNDVLVQWDGPYHPAYKIDPRIKHDSIAQNKFAISLVDASSSGQAVEAIKSIAQRVLIPEQSVGGTIHLRILAESARLGDLARLAEVIGIEPWAEPRPHDERANQISAGTLTFETVSSTQIARPTSPGYLAFLNSIGINSDFDFAVDVGDTGFDLGTDDPSLMHDDFLDAGGASRIAYLADYSGDFHPGPTHDTNGHGTINASIIGGFNNQATEAFRDSLGFQYGLGIAPFARIGISKLFDDDTVFTRTGLSNIFFNARQGGARISNNSWGLCDTLVGVCNQYSEDCTILDAVVRDADPFSGGNQGMVLLFSAGNDGAVLPQAISLHAAAKNVITVGASESFRDGADNCGLGPAGADNALDVISFSAGGPCQDGRAKPDLVAPGTHIVGAASQDQTFATRPSRDLGVCDRFFPSGQTLYTWSSGTSHSTPLASGAAALAFQHLRSRLGAEPSPALVKAFLLNSTTYLTGRLGGDNLPGARQGWGLLNLGRMFNSDSRIVIDQAPERTFTESGGQPFQITGVVTDQTKEFRVMLAWTDPPGNFITNAPYVNRLNLEVTVGGVTYLGNVFNGQYSKTGGPSDVVNNVQGVRLPAGTTGPFVIRVFPTLIAGDGVPGNGIALDQDFALVVSNGTETAVPVLSINTADQLALGVSVLHNNGQTDQSLVPGETARITVTINNLSATAAATIQSAALSITAGGRTNTSGNNSPFPIPAAGSASNPVPFELPIPTELRCGSTASLDLNLTTTQGDVRLKVPVQSGRAQSQVQLLADDVDSNSVVWKLKKGFTKDSRQAHSGSQSYHVEDEGKLDRDSRKGMLVLKKAVSIPANAGHVRLSFFHIFNFEPGFDGGVLEISTDGGVTWEDASSRILVGPYDGKVTEASSNPLGSRFAWTSFGVPGVFSQVVINLDDYAGQRIKLRFIGGFDEATGILDGYTGWFIDDIRITATIFSCS